MDEIVQLLKRRYGEDIPSPALRMARLPESALLHWEEGLRFPLVSVRNVFVFPGVPSFLRLKFEAGAHRWVGSPIHLAQVRIDAREVEIAGLLEDAQEKWPGLSVGSYPRFDEGDFHVIATIEGRDVSGVEACSAWIKSGLSGSPAPKLSD